MLLLLLFTFAQMKTELESLMQALGDHCHRLTALLPMATHAALAYDVTRQLAEVKPQCRLSWDHFTQLFSKAVSDYAEGNHDVTSIALWKMKDSNEVRNAIHGLIRKLNQTLLQEMFR